jgi:retron-type reverse transcriptase
LQIGLPNVATVPHNKGKDCIRDADIAQCFDKINHDALLRKVQSIYQLKDTKSLHHSQGSE